MGRSSFRAAELLAAGPRPGCCSVRPRGNGRPARRRAPNARCTGRPTPGASPGPSWRLPPDTCPRPGRPCARSGEASTRTRRGRGRRPSCRPGCRCPPWPVGCLCGRQARRRSHRRQARLLPPPPGRRPSATRRALPPMTRRPRPRRLRPSRTGRCPSSTNAGRCPAMRTARAGLMARRRWCATGGGGAECGQSGGRVGLFSQHSVMAVPQSVHGNVAIGQSPA